MRVVIQRVSEAEVVVGEESVGKIGRGYLLLLGITHTDGEEDAAYLARKVSNLRLFEDENDKMNLSIQELNKGEGGSILVVSQFTLYGDARKGRRPSFIGAARPEQAEPLYLRFCQLLKDEGLTVATGKFQASMAVSLVNDGPVTLILDTDTLMNKAQQG